MMSSSVDRSSSKLTGPRAHVVSPSTRSVHTAEGRSKEALYLERCHAAFESPSHRVSVFFDECNRQIISVIASNESKTKVVFQSTDSKAKLDFVLPIEKRILSIKLNPVQSVLAYHVEKSNVEFVNVNTVETNDGDVVHELEEKRYIQCSRTKNSKLLGFLWTGPLELVMITDISVEFFIVDANRHRLRYVKSYQSSTNWFVYQPPTGFDSDAANDDVTPHRPVLMVSTGSIGNSLQPYLLGRNQITRLQRFEVEGNWQGSDKFELFERSITISSIYGHVRLLVLQHESLNLKSKGAQILVYTVDQETGTTTRTHTLDLDINGRFAINVLDNLIVAHDQPSKCSFIFDIIADSTEKSDCPKHYVALISGQSVRSMISDHNCDNTSGDNPAAEMYSLNWVFFQPNYIINAKRGVLWTLRLDLEAVQDYIQDNSMLLNFLAHRCNSESFLLNKCKQIVSSSLQAAIRPETRHFSPLADVSAAFEVLGKLVVNAPEVGYPIDDKSRKHQSAKTSGTQPYEFHSSLSQSDVQQEVFRQLDLSDHSAPASFHFVTSVLLEFILATRRHNKEVEFCIYEQLIGCLVKGKKYYQLIQMIRSNIFRDSKQLACLLLSLRHQYRPAAQLGLDMLHRLDCLTDLQEQCFFDQLVR